MKDERGRWFETRYAAFRYGRLASRVYPAFVEGEAYETARRSLVDDIASARKKVIEAKRAHKSTLF